MVDELTAAHMHRVANAPAATHITQRAGTAKQMNWPHDDNAAWGRAHPAATTHRGPSPLDMAFAPMFPAYWVGLWFGMVVAPAIKAMRVGR